MPGTRTMLIRNKSMEYTILIVPSSLTVIRIKNIYNIKVRIKIREWILWNYVLLGKYITDIIIEEFFKLFHK